jgi:hypothetical protein
MKYNDEELSEIYGKLTTIDVNNYISKVFDYFNNRKDEIKKLITNQLEFSAVLNVCNGIDVLAQFYKGVIKNKGNKENKVPNHNCCGCCYDAGCSFNSRVYYKTRAHGDGNKTTHLSPNGKWEPAEVGETYQNFMKNNDEFFDKVDGNNKTIAKLVYDMRNDVDHSGFLESLGYKISIQKNQLLVEKENIKINLFDKFQKMLASYKKDLEKDLKEHKENEKPNIYKTSRIKRFMDRCLYLRVDVK